MQYLKDFFFFNNELSMTRVFLAMGLLLGCIGVLGVYLELIPSKQEIIDLIKWLLGYVFGAKAADNIVAQVFGSPKGENPGPKNPRGD
jgi:hypothetical protein